LSAKSAHPKQKATNKRITQTSHFSDENYRPPVISNKKEGTHRLIPPYKASPIPITTQADPKYKPITSNSDPGGRYRTTTLIANANGIPW